MVTVCIIQSTSKGIGTKLCGVTQDSHEFSGSFHDWGELGDCRPVSWMLTKEKCTHPRGRRAHEEVVTSQTIDWLRVPFFYCVTYYFHKA